MNEFPVKLIYREKFHTNTFYLTWYIRYICQMAGTF